jgi:glycosyltransferase involved in cell wall biosynthesis
MRAAKRQFAVNHAALLGTYLPRKCGIATFSQDLFRAVAGHVGESAVLVLAMDDDLAEYAYPGEVRFQVQPARADEYRLAAQLLNINQIDVAFVQHEYGIYGGPDGELVIEFLRRLRMPVVVTLHTVLDEPSENQARVLREIARLADRLVVMSHRGLEFLAGLYEVPRAKLAFLPHGIPDVPFVDTSFHKDRFGLERHTLLLTYGLLSPGKGIETAIRALPAIVARHPEVVYVVVGATHPHVLRADGDVYREGLERLAAELGLGDHVRFVNRFVEREELRAWMGAADVYITPYLNPKQITSGTLAHACGAGKAVLSTPYWHAQELLAEGRGGFFPFQDAAALAARVSELLDKPVERDAMRKRLYLHCRSMIWQEVGSGYLQVATEVIEERRRVPRRVGPGAELRDGHAPLPALNLRHLRTLTDDTGVYQHAIYTVPDRHHGYCTDDNARALVAALRHFHLHQDPAVLPLVNTYLAFLHAAFDPHLRRFRNLLSYDRRWLDRKGSEDCHARALWALGEAVALAPNQGILGFATRLFNQALPPLAEFEFIRPWAFALVGIHAYLQRFGGDTRVRHLREPLARRLFERFQAESGPEWPWCECTVTYDNGKLPQALLLCGRWLPDPALVEQGLQSLRWLFAQQTHSDGCLSLIGCNGWLTRGGACALFDQQPVEVMSLVDAAAEAWRQTRDPHWREEIRRCLDWFLGRNVVGTPLYDARTDGCRDGLTMQGANQNEGAESTLAWLVSLLAERALEREERQENGSETTVPLALDADTVERGVPVHGAVPCESEPQPRRRRRRA